MKFKLIVFVVNLGLSSFCAAQEVINTSGDYFGNTNGSISWTLGEPVTETFAGINYQLTQGFQQTRLIISSVYDDATNFTLNVSPNPVSNNLNIFTEEHIPFQCALYDMNGRIVFLASGINQKHSIDMHSFINAMYLLKIWDGQGRLIRIFKITKLSIL